MLRYCLPTLFMCLANVASAADAPADPDTSKLLRKHFWVIETRAVDKGKFLQTPPELMQAHLAHQVDLEKSGIMFAAGPAFTEGEETFGIIVIRAANRAEATKIADADPLHTAGVRTYSLREWTVNEGQVNLKINFSDGTYKLE